jgi:hypothetical protein
MTAGQIADRWVSSEKLMGILSAGASVLLVAAWRKTDFPLLWGLQLGAAILASPIIPIGTALSFRHLDDPARQFPKVRVWATIGFVLGTYGLSTWQVIFDRGLDDLAILSAVLAAVNSAYSFTLPATPPSHDRKGPSAAGKALGMLRDPSFAIFVAALFVAQLFSAFYYGRASIFMTDLGISVKGLSAVMSVGQVVEIFMVFVLSSLYVRLGPKRTIALGMAAWVVRFGLLAVGHPLAMMILALSLHGVCFACGRIAATIYVDTICERDARASAQTLLSLTVDGTGMVLGNLIAGAVAAHYRTAGAWHWRNIWIVPAFGCAVALVAFLAGFQARRPAPREAKSAPPPVSPEPSGSSPV